MPHRLLDNAISPLAVTLDSIRGSHDLYYHFPEVAGVESQQPEPIISGGKVSNEIDHLKARSELNLQRPVTASDDTDRVNRIWLSQATPFAIQSEIFAMAGVTSGSKQKKAKTENLRHGFIVDHTLQIEKTRASVWEPSEAVYHHLGIPKPLWRTKGGGYLHTFSAYRIAECAKAQGYTSFLECVLPNGKFVDVLLRKGDQVTLCEVAISKPFAKEVKNALEDFSAGFIPARLIFAVEDSKARNELEAHLASERQLDAFRSIIQVRTIGEFLKTEGVAV